LFTRHYKITDKRYNTSELAGVFEDEADWDKFEYGNTGVNGMKWLAIEIQKTIPHETKKC
jgi:hypothetical protein